MKQRTQQAIKKEDKKPVGTDKNNTTKEVQQQRNNITKANWKKQRVNK